MSQKKSLGIAVAIFQFVLLVFPFLTETRAQKPESARLLTQPEVSALPAAGKRWALIIGVNDYEKDISPLRGSVNDAKALKEVLIRYAGFPANQITMMTTDSPD